MKMNASSKFPALLWSLFQKASGVFAWKMVPGRCEGYRKLLGLMSSCEMFVENFREFYRSSWKTPETNVAGILFALNSTYEHKVNK